MTSELDHAIRSCLDDLVASAPAPQDRPVRRHPAHSSSASWRRLAAVAASLLLVGSLGAAVVASRSGDAKRASDAGEAAVPVETILETTVASVQPSTSPATSPAATSLTVPTSAYVDPTSPVAVTGVHIGDPPPPGPAQWIPDGEIDPAALPAWATVVQDGRVIGYFKPYDMVFGSGPITIFDEEGSEIGALTDGVPFIDQ